MKIEQKKSFANHTICRIKSFHYLRRKLIEMLSFFIILPILYLAGNIYIYLKGKQALKSQSTGVKVLLSIVFWGGALSFFSSFLFRNLDMPASSRSNSFPSRNRMARVHFIHGISSVGI